MVAEVRVLMKNSAIVSLIIVVVAVLTLFSCSANTVAVSRSSVFTNVDHSGHDGCTMNHGVRSGVSK